MTRRVSDLHRTAFVTGAGSGLGRAFAAMLLAEGVRVWGTSRSPEGLAGAFPGGAFTPVRLDLADGAGAVESFRRAAVEAGGVFDLVVNNAGYGVFGEFVSVGMDTWAAHVDAVLMTTVRLSHAAYGPMRARGRGCLVNISSLAAEFPLPYMSGYNVAKAGLSALGESLIFESRGTGVTVVDFRPGDYRTAFNDTMKSQSTPGRPGARPARAASAWASLEAHLRSAPPPEKAAADLRRAILRGRSATVRSGSLFQARIAPLLARISPAAVQRAARDRYHGC
jgi:short-subunit dehydrogenase